MKLGLKSRSRRVVQDSYVAGAAISNPDCKIGCRTDGNRQENGLCWISLPPELLREVLKKIDESESKWPGRKNIVACAGVCKSWREVIKEIVEIPEVSGRITFPISVKQPGPRNSMFPCFIMRNHESQAYYLFANLSQALAADGKFLLAASKHRRATCTEYIITLHQDDTSKGSNTYIGKLRSNFLGTKFVVYDALSPKSGLSVVKSQNTRSIVHSPRVSAGNYSVAHIAYELNVLGARSPRRMHCIMDAIPASAIRPGGVAPTQTHFSLSSLASSSTFSFFRSKYNHLDRTSSGLLSRDRNSSLVLRNRAPRWHERLQCWCLNFHGRVTVASVKNFQLVASPENGPDGPEHEKVILQFGKVGKDVFTMDYCFPISAFQAFAICLSNFDTKIACE